MSEFDHLPPDDEMKAHSDFNSEHGEEEHVASFEERKEPEMSQPQLQTLEEEISQIENSIDEQSYPIGEVPQAHLFDPEIALPINSEKLSKSSAMQGLVDEIEELTRDELTDIQKLQKAIDSWEQKIEQNKVLIEQNKAVIKQNNTEISYDEKNRDYWWRRAENVMTDFGTANAANHTDTWAWFVKKHGLRNLDGTSIDANHACIEELCNGGASNLSGKYKVAGNKYDVAKRNREAENYRLIAENSRYKATIDTLQKYIQSTYQDRIEPLQDGVLLLKELGAKVRGLISQSDATFEDLRSWAEDFLNEYLIENPNTPQNAVTDFRRIASIPLPSENS